MTAQPAPGARRASHQEETLASMIATWRDAGRWLMTSGLFFLPRPRRKSIDRRLRGREEYRKLQLADYVLMSWGKSGRTWLRVMLSRFYQIAYGIPEGRMLEFDNLKRANPAIPSVLFTHGNYLRDYTGNWTDRSEFYGKRIVMLVRDPRDIAVSQYFQWKHRMRPVKKMLNDYPTHGAEVPIFDFMMNPDVGLPEIIDFLESWERELPRARESIVIRYEDMRADPEQALRRVLAFLSTPGNEDQIRAAVAYAAYENMKRLEQKRVFWQSGLRLRPGDRSNPQSYKVRRAKVGGWRDYFDDQQVRAIDGLLAARPKPPFGYGAAARARRSA
jgi:Sulfotransferase domain